VTRWEFHAALKTLLLADTGLDNWATTNFGSSLTALESNRPVAQINTKLLPALIFEMDDGTTQPQVSGYSQEVQTAELVAVGFVEHDLATAFQRRAEAVDLMVQAVMADPTLGGKVYGAWVSRFEPDRGANHPKYFTLFTVSGEYQVKKA